MGRYHSWATSVASPVKQVTLSVDASDVGREVLSIAGCYPRTDGSGFTTIWLPVRVPMGSDSRHFKGLAPFTSHCLKLLAGSLKGLMLAGSNNRPPILDAVHGWHSNCYSDFRVNEHDMNQVLNCLYRCMNICGNLLSCIYERAHAPTISCMYISICTCHSHIYL